MEQERTRGHFTAPEWKALCEWFGNACLRCGSTEKLSPDHVIPLSKGGMNDISNIQPLCLFCNYSKNNRNSNDYRDPEQLARFLESLHGDEEEK
jgi:5-methylcytosine-specific restriction endonuclease McrA